MLPSWRRAGGAVAVALPLLVFVSACDREDAVVDVSGPDPILNFAMTPGDASSLPRGTVAVAESGSELTLGVTGLPSLSGAVYKAFLVQRGGGAAAAATGTYTVGDGEPAVESSFGSPAHTAQHRLVVTPGTVGQDPAEYDRVVISLEASGGAATPSNPFLVFDYRTDAGAVTSSGALILGRVVAGDEVERFGVTGVARGHIFRDSLVVTLRRVAAPPAGWVYRGFVAELTRDGFQKEQPLGTIALDDDGNADLRVGSSEIGGLAAYNTFVLALHPSVGDAGTLSPLMIQVSDDYRAKHPGYFSQ